MDEDETMQMTEWGNRWRLGAVAVVVGAWVLGVYTYLGGHSTRWVWLGLAVWLSVGLAYRAFAVGGAGDDA